LAATVDRVVVSGTVDRLLVEESRITVVDFKTTRRPPETADEIPAATLKQMAAYVAALEVIYPSRDVRAGVLYTHAPQLFEIAPETLAPHLCDVLTSMEETVEVVREVNHPAVQTMFDTHNAVAEKLPHDELIKKYAAYIKHVHLNEMDGRHPGTGSYDFSVPLQALKDISYEGWLSLEVFHFEPSGEEVARASLEHLRRIEAKLS